MNIDAKSLTKHHHIIKQNQHRYRKGITHHVQVEIILIMQDFNIQKVIKAIKHTKSIKEKIV